jgi:hypothetical protein
MPQGIGPSTNFFADRQNTLLAPDDENKFQKWAKLYNIGDVDPKTGEVYSDSNYDLRGYWKENYVPGMIGFGPVHVEGGHFPDTYKQSGHPTFSQESNYSNGPSQGGMWVGPNKDIFLKQPKMRR